MVKIALFLSNAAFPIATLDLISRVHRASFVIVLPHQLKYSHSPVVFHLS